MANELDTNIPVIEAFAEILPLVYDSEDLAQVVLHKVQDASYSYDDVLKIFNKCLLRLSGKYLFPKLEIIRDIETDLSGSIPVPADYQKNLRYAHSITHNHRVRVFGSVIQLNRHFSHLDQTGIVRGLAIRNRRIYYQRIPSSAETIRINYYAYPERMEKRYHKPNFLPVHLVEPLLFNFACAEIYSEIEDGIDGQKINTAYYKAEYANVLVELEQFLGPEEKEPVEIVQELQWDLWAYG
jgi:hypothetical protein